MIFDDENCFRRWFIHIHYGYIGPFVQQPSTWHIPDTCCRVGDAERLGHCTPPSSFFPSSLALDPYLRRVLRLYTGRDSVGFHWERVEWGWQRRSYQNTPVELWDCVRSNGLKIQIPTHASSFPSTWNRRRSRRKEKKKKMMMKNW